MRSTTLTQLCSDFVSMHERCAARAAGVPDFQVITTVPSADPLRDLHHPMRRIVGELAEPTRERYERLLVRSDSSAIPRVFDPARYRATRRLDGEAVLLIDDMWTSGASAESAAAALLRRRCRRRSPRRRRAASEPRLARERRSVWVSSLRDGFDPGSCALSALSPSARPVNDEARRRPAGRRRADHQTMAESTIRP